jgi:hypothetical protein
MPTALMPLPPLAADQPDGSYTIVLTDTQRRQLYALVVVIGLSCFGAGMLVARGLALAPAR